MGVVERTDGIAQTVRVATVEPATEAAEVSEARREMLWKMVEECGEELTQEQKQQFFLLYWLMLMCLQMTSTQDAPMW